jgi:hypothetical protein
MPMGHTISCTTTDKEVMMPVFPIKTKIYAHRDESENSDLADWLGFTNEDVFTENIYHMGETLTFDVEISEDGTTMVTHFNGMALVAPVEMT